MSNSLVPLTDTQQTQPPDRVDPLDRLLACLPAPARRLVDRLLRPEARWLRIPLAILMILGGLLGFLPILGFWMLPIGLILLGEDIPPIRRVTLRALAAVQALWDRMRSRRPRR